MTEETLIEQPVAAAQIIGQRERQEDAIDMKYVHPDSGMHADEKVLVLADGMGGHVGGETASNMTVEIFMRAYLESDEAIPQAMRLALDTANESMAEVMEEQVELSDMGTTLVCGVVTGNHLYWLSVGDSPLWLYRDHELHKINADHSMVPILEGLVEIGRMSAEEAAVDSRRNQLRSAVIGEELVLVDVSPEPLELQQGDMVLLASDGVETLNDSQIISLLESVEDDSPEKLVSSVLKAVEDVNLPEQDNASLILYLN